MRIFVPLAIEFCLRLKETTGARDQRFVRFDGCMCEERAMKTKLDDEREG